MKRTGGAMGRRRDKIKVAVFLGTRPEAIKMAPVILSLKASGEFEPKVVATAQHRTMLDQTLEIFGITPDRDLNVMKRNQSLYGLTSALTLKLGEYFSEEKPDWALVQGDTTTAFCAALAAYYAKCAVGHVEAGLRTGDIYSPWPEEVNRKLVSSIALLHFAPTKAAAENLRKEGIPKNQIKVTGNTVVDALFHARGLIMNDPRRLDQYRRKFAFLDPKKKLILVTGHRRENHGEGMLNICNALRELAKWPEAEVVYPVHLNPNVKDVVSRELGKVKGIHLIEPQDYLSFVYLMNLSHLILTDSGGIQEEAPSFGKPVLVMREVTERPEGVAAGAVKLIGAQAGKIVRETLKLLKDKRAYSQMSRVKNPYGDGAAAKRILKELAKRR